MNNTSLVAGACALAFCTALSAHEGQVPQPATFTTQAFTPLAIEGLAADSEGNLYTTGRATAPALCPVWRITGPSLTVVGFIPNDAPCNPSGIAFDRAGDLYVADGGAAATIWRLTPDAATPPTGVAFATGVPGTNGLAFDRDGNLWTGDGTTGNGRVWRISPAGGVEEMFRIQPMRNSTALGGNVAGDGVGRQARTFPPGTLANNQGGQDLVANGLAFTPEGDLYIADTARGAIWKVEFDGRGELKSRTGCDTTFTANTLCLDNVFVAHPYLEGTDGIALDRAGNIWNSANERNAIVVVTRQGQVHEVFRNPASAGLRNAGPLEFPTSPVLVGKRFCTSNSDGNRRDNSPNSAGEIGGAGQPRGKISCMGQELEVPGARLPVR